MNTTIICVFKESIVLSWKKTGNILSWEISRLEPSTHRPWTWTYRNVSKYTELLAAWILNELPHLEKKIHANAFKLYAFVCERTLNTQWATEIFYFFILFKTDFVTKQKAHFDIHFVIFLNRGRMSVKWINQTEQPLYMEICLASRFFFRENLSEFRRKCRF